jgi:hydroxyacylglutathione hydrolase
MLEEIFPSLFWLRASGRSAETPFTYLLRRPEGNILFGTKEDASPFARELRSMGGVQAILLGDRHHALPHSVAFAGSMGTVLTASDVEAKALKAAGVDIGRALAHVKASFAADLEIIPTPGHTRGAFSYLWTNGKKRYLFIGDTIVPNGEGWNAYVTKPNRPLMARTLQLLATVKFDVILSNSFAANPVAWREVTAQARPRMFGDLLASLTA